ncbi:Putative gustatory receptor 28b [Cyphomyrmex costatus]|uniref:Gustatory receptor n=1 Tax=Cyphomyrmex costatus TaxID=456900 RepID=A0A195CSS5_9HYME|nr:Putative gustatory receptor 28b [Cyphomyrmex costatus]
MRKKRSLFNATDFQTLMYPCFIFCRILGLFPYKVNNSTFETSKPCYILSITITCIFCVCDLILLTYNQNFTKINFETATMSIEAYYFYALSAFLSIVTLFLSNPRMRLLQTIMDISSRLSPKSYKKLSRLIHTKDIFGSIYLMSVMSIFVYITRTDILNVIFSTYATLSSFQMDMLYINCVCVLKACFKDINNNLQHMQEFIINSELRTPVVLYYKQRNSFLIMKLKILKKQHMMISNAVQILNTIFWVQLLASMTITFCQINLELYYLIQWHDGLVISLNGQISEIIILSIIYYIVKLALTVWACETGKNQAQEIRTTIHDVLNRTRDEQIKEELQSFSLQMLHCKNTFSAKGFNVDATFLATVSNRSFPLIIEIYLVCNYFILLSDGGYNYYIYINFVTILYHVSFLR